MPRRNAAAALNVSQAAELTRKMNRLQPLIAALKANLKAESLHAAVQTAFDLQSEAFNVWNELRKLEATTFEPERAVTQSRKGTS